MFLLFSLRIHGTGIFSYTWMVDFYSKCVGKLTSSMDFCGNQKLLTCVLGRFFSLCGGGGCVIPNPWGNWVPKSCFIVVSRGSSGGCCWLLQPCALQQVYLDDFAVLISPRSGWKQRAEMWRQNYIEKPRDGIDKTGGFGSGVIAPWQVVMFRLYVRSPSHDSSVNEEHNYFLLHFGWKFIRSILRKQLGYYSFWPVKWQNMAAWTLTNKMLQ